MKKPGLFDRLSIEYNRRIDGIINAGDFMIDAIAGKGEYKDTGSGGERMTYSIILEYFSRKHVFRNVYLPHSNGRLTEIDLIALNDKGIFVFESKNYSGWIFGNSTERYWMQTLPNRQKNRFYNPVWQNASHIDALDANLGERFPQLEYYSLIVFSERCELKKITNTEPGTYIFQRQELHFYLKQLKKELKESLLDNEEVERIAEWLSAHERPDEEVRQQHLAELEKAAHTCPRCGGELVQRQNRRTGETFLGCSAFPKCRYVSKEK